MWVKSQCDRLHKPGNRWSRWPLTYWFSDRASRDTSPVLFFPVGGPVSTTDILYDRARLASASSVRKDVPAHTPFLASHMSMLSWSFQTWSSWKRQPGHLHPRLGAAPWTFFTRLRKALTIMADRRSARTVIFMGLGFILWKYCLNLSSIPPDAFELTPDYFNK